MSPHHEQARPPRLRRGGGHGRIESLEVVAVFDLEGVPTVGGVACTDILGEAQVGRAVDGDPIRIVEDVELAETEVTGPRRSLCSDTSMRSPSLASTQVR